ncbi:MAG: hypothetical protein E7390_10165 [Ruminococcaceae bacterium]|nr:hypothetical protein [Oscillospiraceae bacterium]
MEQTGVKNPKLRIIFAVAMAVLIVAFIVTMCLPMITYTPKDAEGKLLDGEKTISLMSFLWMPTEHSGISDSASLAKLYKAELQAEFETPINAAFPPALFAFLMGLISLAIVIFAKKKPWNVYFPIIWSFVSLIFYLANPFMRLSVIDPTIKLIQMIILGLTLIVAVVAFFTLSLPQIRYDIAHREKY